MHLLTSLDIGMAGAVSVLGDADPDCTPCTVELMDVAFSVGHGKSRYKAALSLESFRTRTPIKPRWHKLRTPCGLLLTNSWSAISRRTHHARETCRKVARYSPVIEEKREELRARLLGESDDWVESINFAVRNELDGQMAYRLLKNHGVIPTAEQDVARYDAGGSRRKSRSA
jgi:hypothetical protein